jgi:hypothetical protein
MYHTALFHCCISQFHLRVILKSQRFLFAYLMVFNATFNNISAISWRSVYLWKKLEDLEKSNDMSQVTNKLYHNVLYISLCSRFELTTSVVIVTDCIGSCKTNYHTITAMTVPNPQSHGWIICLISRYNLTNICFFKENTAYNCSNKLCYNVPWDSETNNNKYCDLINYLLFSYYIMFANADLHQNCNTPAIKCFIFTSTCLVD